MTPLKAIIIDDEKHAREALTSLLSMYCPQVVILAEGDSVKTGLQSIRQLQPEVVFLDIAIGEETGFDLVKQLQPIDFQLIFTTAFNEYALHAFRANAIDYLLKPINPKELIVAVNKAQKSKNTQQLDHQFQQLFQTINPRKKEKIAVSTMDGITYLEIDQVIHIIGNGNYSTFHLSDGEKIMASKNLKHFEVILPKEFFFRSHQSHLVNLHFIKKIQKSDGLIHLSNNAQIPITRHKRDLLIQKMKNR